jgi:hypothetical protein
VIVASRELRALAVAGLLAILATAWIGRPLGDLSVIPEVFGFAYCRIRGRGRDPIRGDPVPLLGAPSRGRRARRSRCRC